MKKSFLFLTFLLSHLLTSLAQIPTPFCDKKHLWGYENEKEKVIIPAQFLSADTFGNGLALIQKPVEKPDPNDEYGTEPPLIYNLYGYIDITGKIVIPCQYDEAKSFSEGLAAVEDFNERGFPIWGFIDATGKIVIPCQYDDVSDFREGLAAVASGYNPDKFIEPKWGFIDHTGKLIIPMIYKSVTDFHFGESVVTNDKDQEFIMNKWGEIDE